MSLFIASAHAAGRRETTTCRPRRRRRNLPQKPVAQYRIDQKGSDFRTRRKVCWPVGATDPTTLSAGQKNKTFGKSRAVNNYYNSNLPNFKYIWNNLSYSSRSARAKNKLILRYTYYASIYSSIHYGYADSILKGCGQFAGASSRRADDRSEGASCRAVTCQGRAAHTQSAKRPCVSGCRGSAARISSRPANSRV